MEILSSGNLPEKIRQILIVKTTLPHGFFGQAHEVAGHLSLGHLSSGFSKPRKRESSYKWLNSPAKAQIHGLLERAGVGVGERGPQLVQLPGVWKGKACPMASVGQ